MRHNKKFNHLGRKSAHRKAMLSNMACSLILHKRITTTTAKAKALKIYVEPLITKSKDDTTHNRRIVFSYLKDKDSVSELFREISPKIGERPGGYTRILKTGSRLGDNAEMCILELVDYNENMLAAKEEKKSTSRRRRSSGAKKKVEAPVSAAKHQTETPVAEAEEVNVVEDVAVDEAPESLTDEAKAETSEDSEAEETKE